jgi:hypothetical protein
MTPESALAVASQSDADSAPARRRRIRVDGGKRGLARIDGRRRKARRVNELMRQYTERLGDHAVEPDRVRRCAELVAIAEDLRAAKLRGEAVDAGELYKAEGYADRALRALGLDKPREPVYVPLRERLAREAEQQLPSLAQMLREQHG